jgi:hypothetical protein
MSMGAPSFFALAFGHIIFANDVVSCNTIAPASASLR